MIQKSFMRIFWGLLFIILDININDLDLILPDFFGYILIYTALASLEQLHPRFGKAKPYAAAMVIVSLAEMLHINPLSVLRILEIILNLLMIWHICTAISEVALERSNNSLSDMATKRRTLYMVVSLTQLIVAAIVLVAPELIGVIAVPLIVFTLTAVLLVMMLMRRASLEIS